jgi:tRNA U34 2-thiouridine synthase MnmA/TrmU
MQKAKALVLFSGGLDSMLAVKILQNQGIEVEGICFASIFFSCQKVKQAAESIGLQLKKVDISEELLEIVKNPPSGYGKHLNPCIDCHALMIKRAGEHLNKNVSGITGSFSRKRPQDDKCHFIATGEVLGQRPFSQNSQTLIQVEKLSGIEVLRPLSAKLLPETDMEKRGLVNRGRLLSIRGRSRGQQMELAEKYKLKEFATPAGGCLLTDPEFSQRLGKMLDYWPACTAQDVELLRYGRVFWLTQKDNSQRALLIIGRHKDDDKKLEKTVQKGDIMLELKEIAGPTTVIKIKNQKSKIKNNKIMEIEVPNSLKMSTLKLGEEKEADEILEIAGLLTGYYATKARGKKVRLDVKINN